MCQEENPLLRSERHAPSVHVVLCNDGITLQSKIVFLRVSSNRETYPEHGNHISNSFRRQSVCLKINT